MTNGPDLEVWLVEAADPASSDDVKASEWLSLGPLKGNKGYQIYPVPEGTPISSYHSVVIWCDQFGVLFSPASLAARE
ncbi:MAG: DM13 domain-containing protein [Kiloniellales bacterium]